MTAAIKLANLLLVELQTGMGRAERFAVAWKAFIHILLATVFTAPNASPGSSCPDPAVHCAVETTVNLTEAKTPDGADSILKPNAVTDSRWFHHFSGYYTHALLFTAIWRYRAKGRYFVLLLPKSLPYRTAQATSAR